MWPPRAACAGRHPHGAPLNAVIGLCGVRSGSRARPSCRLLGNGRGCGSASSTARGCLRRSRRRPAAVAARGRCPCAGRSPLRPTMTVEPSCPSTPSGSGRYPARSQITRAVMKAAAMARLAMTTRRARRESPMTAGTVASSSRTMTALAVSSARSDLARPIAMPVPAVARAGASLTPSPASSTRCPAVCRARTASAFSWGRRPARTSLMPTRPARRAAARGLSPVGRTGTDPVRAVMAATVEAAAGRSWSAMPSTPARTRPGAPRRRSARPLPGW